MNYLALGYIQMFFKIYSMRLFITNFVYFWTIFPFLDHYLYSMYPIQSTNWYSGGIYYLTKCLSLCAYNESSIKWTSDFANRINTICMQEFEFSQVSTICTTFSCLFFSWVPIIGAWKYAENSNILHLKTAELVSL